MAILSAVQLLFSAIHPDRQHVCALVSVHAAVLYGRESCVALGQRGTGCGFVAGRHQDNVRLERLWDADYRCCCPSTANSAMLPQWLLVLVRSDAGWRGIMLFGFACIAMARWSRSRGSNALVLHATRGSAARPSRSGRRCWPPTLERNRIGTAMQAEVLNTLESVITQADDGTGHAELRTGSR